MFTFGLHWEAVIGGVVHTCSPALLLIPSRTLFLFLSLHSGLSKSPKTSGVKPSGQYESLFCCILNSIWHCWPLPPWNALFPWHCGATLRFSFSTSSSSFSALCVQSWGPAVHWVAQGLVLGPSVTQCYFLRHSNYTFNCYLHFDSQIFVCNPRPLWAYSTFLLECPTGFSMWEDQKSDSVPTPHTRAISVSLPWWVAPASIQFTHWFLCSLLIPLQFALWPAIIF